MTDLLPIEEQMLTSYIVEFENTQIRLWLKDEEFYSLEFYRGGVLVMTFLDPAAIKTIRRCMKLCQEYLAEVSS